MDNIKSDWWSRPVFELSSLLTCFIITCCCNACSSIAPPPPPLLNIGLFMTVEINVDEVLFFLCEISWRNFPKLNFCFWQGWQPCQTRLVGTWSYCYITIFRVTFDSWNSNIDNDWLCLTFDYHQGFLWKRLDLGVYVRKTGQMKRMHHIAVSPISRMLL